MKRAQQCESYSLLEDRVTQLFSSFAQDEITIRPDRLNLSLGARLEHNSYTGFDLEPSARLVWTPDSKNMIWSAVSGADRTPARSDTDVRVNYTALPGPGNMPLLVSLFGNPNFRNERLTAFEGGYRNAWTSRFSSPFRRAMSDMLWLLGAPTTASGTGILRLTRYTSLPAGTTCLATP